jgi:hypothetical protein
MTRPLPVHTRVYYTGDVCNQPAWGSVDVVESTGGGTQYRILFDDGSASHILDFHIGDVYRGHCDPRFVTEAAYRAYRPD